MSQRPGWLPFALLVLAVALPRQGAGRDLAGARRISDEQHRRLRQLPHPAGPGRAAAGHGAGRRAGDRDPAFTVHTPNITPDPETGIGSWTDDQIKRAITQGISADGTLLMPPMGFSYYARLSAADLDALLAYLRSLPPLAAEDGG